MVRAGRKPKARNSPCVAYLFADHQRGENYSERTRRKSARIEDRQAEIAVKIEQHQTGDDPFRATLESMISVASRAVDLIISVRKLNKTQLVLRVFSSLRLNGKKLEYTMRSPFDLMVNRPDHATWLGS
jgi:hypothetical protein